MANTRTFKIYKVSSGGVLNLPDDESVVSVVPNDAGTSIIVVTVK